MTARTRKGGNHQLGLGDSQWSAVKQRGMQQRRTGKDSGNLQRGGNIFCSHCGCGYAGVNWSKLTETVPTMTAFCCV